MKVHLYPGRDVLPDWNNPEIVSREILHPHAYFVPFPDAASCREALADNRRYLSPWIELLNGQWECKLYSDVLQLPENIVSLRTGFKQTDVPVKDFSPDNAGGREEFWDFPLVFPQVPVHQPVIMYKKKFRLPLRWSGLRKKLVMLGVNAAAHVFCNGKAVGYTEGSRISSEVDLTTSLLEGENEVAILVWQRSGASYMQDTDVKLPAGIIGEIYLQAYPSLFVHDLKINTKPHGEEGSWKLEADVKLLSCRIAREAPGLRLELWRDNLCISETVWQVPLHPVNSDEYTRPVQTAGEIKISIPLQSIEAWSSETPVLYDLYISLEEKNGQELMALHKAVGFRYLQQQGEEFLLNNRALSLLAACWNQCRHLSVGELVHNLKLLRRHNLNCLYIRSCSVDPILLELCDIFGVYVISDVSFDIKPELLESFLGDAAMLKKAQNSITRTIARDSSHPCIIAWSAGIFRRKHPGIDLFYREMRKCDQGRFIHIRELPDIISDVDKEKLYGSESTDFIARLTRLAEESRPGRCFGNWFPTPHKSKLPELLNSQEMPTRLLNELKYLLSPLHFRAIDAEDGAFMALNRLSFLPASCFRISWVLTRNGQFKLAGELDNIRAAPGQEQFVEIWYGDNMFSDGADYVLRFEIQLASTSLWAGYAYEVGLYEFVLSRKAEFLTPVTKERIGRLRVENERHHIIVSGPRFWMVFNRLSGSLESWRSGEKEMLASPVFSPSGLEPVVSSGGDLSRHVVSLQQACDGQSALIEFVSSWGKNGMLPILQSICRYEIDSRGKIRLYASLEKIDDEVQLPEFSLMLVLARGFHNISWAGKGPFPGLPGMHLSGKTGIYQDKTFSKNTAGAEPGVYSNCIWLNAADDSGFGLGIRAERDFSYSVRSFKPKKMTDNNEMQNIIINCQIKNKVCDEPARLFFELRTVIE